MPLKYYLNHRNCTRIPICPLHFKQNLAKSSHTCSILLLRRFQKTPHTVHKICIITCVVTANRTVFLHICPHTHEIRRAFFRFVEIQLASTRSKYCLLWIFCCKHGGICFVWFSRHSLFASSPYPLSSFVSLDDGFYKAKSDNTSWTSVSSCLSTSFADSWGRCIVPWYRQTAESPDSWPNWKFSLFDLAVER